jgi:hypothetical protein
MSRKGMVVAPISVRTTWNCPAIEAEASATCGLRSELVRSPCSATADSTDIKCDLPVP